MCVLHANRGKKLLQNLQNLVNTSMKRSVVRFKGAQGRHDICGVFRGLATRHDRVLPVEGDLRKEPEMA